MSIQLTPLRIALLYTVFGVIWIFSSAAFLSFTVQDAVLQNRLEIGKGLFFVAVTGVLLYLLLRRWYAVLQNSLKQSDQALQQLQEQESELHAAKNQLQATLDAIPDLLFEYDLDGRYWAFHSPRTDLLSVPVEDFLGKSIFDVLPEEVAKVILSALQEAHVLGFSHGKTYELMLPQGRRFFELSVSRKSGDTSPPENTLETTEAADSVEATERREREAESAKDEAELRFIALVRDVTERKQADEKLDESEFNYRTLANSGQALIWTAGLDKLCTYFNQKWLDFTGRSFEQEQGIGWTENIHPDDYQRCLDTFMQAFDERKNFSMDYRLRRYDGEYRWVQDDGSPRYNASGEFVGYIGYCLDITERKLAEAKIKHLSNIYAALSQCNQAIVRCVDETELFPQICLDAVKFGGFKMTWIGMVDAESGLVKPVASYGEGTEYLQDIQIQIDANNPNSHGPVGTAIRENKPVWIQDFMQDQNCAPWHARAEKFGWQSVAALPIERNGKVVGSFNLYSADLNAFDLQAQDLLIEMAMDISFALKTYDLEADRKKATEALRASEQHLRTLVETEPECVKVLDKQGNLLQMNAAGIAMLEADNFEHVQQNYSVDIVMPEYRAAFLALHERVLKGETGMLEFQVTGLKGKKRWLETHEAPMHSENGEVISILGITRDITERKQVEQLNKENEEKYRLLFDRSMDGILILEDDHFIEYNQAVLNMTGFSAEQIKSTALWELSPPLQPDKRASKQKIQDMVLLAKTQGQHRFEWVLRHQDGEDFTVEITFIPITLGGKEVIYTTLRDITDNKAAEERIRQLANFDTLTGLPNRALLTDRVTHALNIAQRSNLPLTLMFLDLDHFKNVNDTLGHRIGDALLKILAERLRATVREEDTISRLGGDEFILVLPATNGDGASHVAEKLLQTVSRPYKIEQYELIVTPSIGIAIYPGDGEDFEALSKCADIAMYRAKESGRNTYRFFTPEMQERSVRTLQLENALRHAVKDHQLVLEYQPQLSLDTGKIIGAEALLRWRHPVFGLVPPTDFISLAENTGQIFAIGEWVLKTAMQQLKTWMDSGLEPVIMSVNLSAVQFRHQQLSEKVARIVESAGVAPQYLELELTEGAAMENPQAAVEMMDSLHAQGIRLSIDDFGTGYSSLSYLKRFQVYKLKIDRSFVRDVTHDPEDEVIVRAIISLAKSLGMRTIAEGVESAEQQAFLKKNGCDEIQGYFLSAPLPAEQFEAFVRKTNATNQATG